MEKLNNIIITKINEIVTVPSPKGRYNEIKNRYCFGISFCNSGKITYTHNGMNFVSDKSCAVILPKGQRYSLYGNESGSFPVINFECEGFSLDTIKIIPLKNADSYLKDYERIKDLFLFKNNNLKALSILYDILNRLATEEISEKSELKETIEFIENNYSNPELSNTLLAEKIHISEVYFRRIFKESFGITPKQFILDIRIKKAKQLISYNELNITKIAELCGFSTVYHFCRAFKEKTGLTPTEYKKSANKYSL